MVSIVRVALSKLPSSDLVTSGLRHLLLYLAPPKACRRMAFSATCLRHSAIKYLAYFGGPGTRERQVSQASSRGVGP